MNCAARRIQYIVDCDYSCLTALVINLTLLTNPSKWFLRYISVTKKYHFEIFNN